MQRIIPPKIQQYIELKEDEMGWKIAKSTPPKIRQQIETIIDEIDNEFKLEKV